MPGVYVAWMRDAQSQAKVLQVAVKVQEVEPIVADIVKAEIDCMRLVTLINQHLPFSLGPSLHKQWSDHSNGMQLFAMDLVESFGVSTRDEFHCAVVQLLAVQYIMMSLGVYHRDLLPRNLCRRPRAAPLTGLRFFFARDTACDIPCKAASYAFAAIDWGLACTRDRVHTPRQGYVPETSEQWCVANKGLYTLAKNEHVAVYGGMHPSWVTLLTLFASLFRHAPDKDCKEWLQWAIAMTHLHEAYDRYSETIRRSIAVNLPVHQCLDAIWQQRVSEQWKQAIACTDSATILRGCIVREFLTDVVRKSTLHHFHVIVSPGSDLLSIHLDTVLQHMRDHEAEHSTKVFKQDIKQ